MVSGDASEQRADAPTPPDDDAVLADAGYRDWAEEGYSRADAAAFLRAGIELSEAMEWAEYGFHDLDEILAQPGRPWDDDDEDEMCECGNPGSHPIWNGKHTLSVCDSCWKQPETIATEALVRLAEDGADPSKIGDYVRDACQGGRVEVTDELVATVTRLHGDWYGDGGGDDDGERRCSECGESYNLEEVGGEAGDRGMCVSCDLHTGDDDDDDPADEPAPVKGGDMIAAIGEITSEKVYVEQTGGGTATIYIGPVWQDDEGYDRQTLMIGPGSFDWGSPNDSQFSFGEVCVGPDDDGETDPIYVSNMDELRDAVRHFLDKK